MRYLITGMSAVNGKNIIWESDICELVDYQTDKEMMKYIKEYGDYGNVELQCLGDVCIGTQHIDLNNSLLYKKPIEIYGIKLTYYDGLCITLEYDNELWVLNVDTYLDKAFHLPLVSKGVLMVFKGFIMKCEFIRVPTTVSRIRRCYLLKDTTYLRNLCMKYMRDNNNVRSEFKIQRWYK